MKQKDFIFFDGDKENKVLVIVHESHNDDDTFNRMKEMGMTWGGPTRKFHEYDVILSFSLCVDGEIWEKRVAKNRFGTCEWTDPLVSMIMREKGAMKEVGELIGECLEAAIPKVKMLNVLVGPNRSVMVSEETGEIYDTVEGY